MADKKKNENRKKTGLGFALWVLAALVLLVAFLINQKRIASNLKATGFLDKTIGKNPEFIEKAEKTKKAEDTENEVAPIELEDVEIDFAGNTETKTSGYSDDDDEIKEISAQNDITQKQIDSTARRKELRDSENEEGLDTESRTETSAWKKAKKETVVKKEVTVNTAEKNKTMRIKLYFMTINSSGSVSRIEVTREMTKSSSPLSDAVKALIEGPNSSEESKDGCRSLLSSGTRLIGASVRNGIATLNFSSEFEYNQYGIEGLRGQLQQIVFTATAFPTVDSVQFLVDGEKKEYLGSEGVWIGTPLNRNSF